MKGVLSRTAVKRKAFRMVVATNGTALNTMHSDIGGTWVEYGVGGNFRLCKNAYGYVDLERTSGAEVNANYRWNIGLRTFF